MRTNTLANRYYTIEGDHPHLVYFNTEDLSPINLISIWDGEGTWKELWKEDVIPYVPTVLDYIDTVRVLKEFAEGHDPTGSYSQIYKAIWDIEAILCL